MCKSTFVSETAMSLIIKMSTEKVAYYTNSDYVYHTNVYNDFL